jgi:hypothetical protein
MTLRFGSMRTEEGGSRRCTARQRWPLAATALPNEGGRRSPRWAVLGRMGQRGERTKLRFGLKSLTGCRNSFENKSKF